MPGVHRTASGDREWGSRDEVSRPKVTNSPRISGFGIRTTDTLTTELRADEAKLEARRTRLSELPFGGYTRAEVESRLRRINMAEDGDVVAHVHELTDLYFEESTTFEHTSYSMTHVLIFHRTRTGWLLATATRPPGTKCGVPPETQFCT